MHIKIISVRCMFGVCVHAYFCWVLICEYGHVRGTGHISLVIHLVCGRGLLVMGPLEEQPKDLNHWAMSPASQAGALRSLLCKSGPASFWGILPSLPPISLEALWDYRCISWHQTLHGFWGSKLATYRAITSPTEATISLFISISINYSKPQRPIAVLQ